MVLIRCRVQGRTRKVTIPSDRIPGASPSPPNSRLQQFQEKPFPHRYFDRIEPARTFPIRAPFQLGWGSANAGNCLAEDITAIRNEITRKPDTSSNTAFLIRRGQKSRDAVENLTFRTTRKTMMRPGSQIPRQNQAPTRRQIRPADLISR